MPGLPWHPLHSWLATMGTCPPPQRLRCSSGIGGLEHAHLVTLGQGAEGEWPGQRVGACRELQGEVKMCKEAYRVLDGRWQALTGGWHRAQRQVLERLREEKERHRGLEQQVNTLLRLHMAEVRALHHTAACVRERVAYGSHKRARNVLEVLEALQSRLDKVEAQQPVAQLEEQDQIGATWHHLPGQLMRLTGTMAAILLVCVSLAVACALSLLRGHRQALRMFSIVALLSVAWHYCAAR